MRYQGYFTVDALYKLLTYLSLTWQGALFIQVTYQLKLLTTALFCVVMLQKHLSKVQWLSLVIQFAGVALIQLQPQKTASPNKTAEMREQNVRLGFAALLAACVMSGFACVYLEKLLKHTAPSIYLREYTAWLYRRCLWPVCGFRQGWSPGR